MTRGFGYSVHAGLLEGQGHVGGFSKRLLTALRRLEAKVGVSRGRSSAWPGGLPGPPLPAPAVAEDGGSLSSRSFLCPRFCVQCPWLTRTQSHGLILVTARTSAVVWV